MTQAVYDSLILDTKELRTIEGANHKNITYKGYQKNLIKHI